jgi:hypothetical protein
MVELCDRLSKMVEQKHIDYWRVKQAQQKAQGQLGTWAEAEATAARFRNLACDIEIELTKLAKLESQIKQVPQDIEQAPEYAAPFYESLALKFHSFYMGCERIFYLVEIELNGDISKHADWHQRLLDCVEVEKEYRKAVITPETAQHMQAFLVFQQAVRHPSEFEITIAYINRLIEQYLLTWPAFEQEMQLFVGWLKERSQMHLVRLKAG